MEDHWQGKNVDLSILSERVKQFLMEKQFGTIMRKEKKGYLITAYPKPFHEISEEINVHILGDPDDFSVKFVAGAHSNNLVRYGTILSLLGAGFFVAKGLKSLEEIEKVERKFWVYVDETVWQLASSK